MKGIICAAVAACVACGAWALTPRQQHLIDFQKQQKYTELWGQRAVLFDELGCDSTNIVMLGNSLTHGCEWHEIFNNPKVLNRGIIGDVVPGITERIDAVVEGKPAKIFLLSGANDVSHDLSADSIAANYAVLIDIIRQRTPDTKLYVQSTLPINNSFNRYKNLAGKEQVIRDLNKHLAAMADEKGYTWIDLTDIFADENGNLRADWSNDGLHILAPGYKAWAECIRPYINE